MTPAFAACGKEVARNKDKYGGAYIVPYGRIEKGASVRRMIG